MTDNNTQPQLTMLQRKALRHTSRVTFLKKFLPAISLVIIGVMLVWPILKDTHRQQDPILTDEHKSVIKRNKVLNPKIISLDKKGQPYTIKSRYAEHHSDNITSFDQPCSAFTTAAGEQVNTQAEHAIFDKSANKINYFGHVDLSTNQNYEIHTTTACHDIEHEQITSNDIVDASSASCNIHSDQGFNSTMQNVHFKGNVKLNIKNHRAEDLQN